MTYKRLFIFIFLTWIITVFLKYLFYESWQFDNAATQFLYYAIVSGIVVAILARKLLGVINYLEAIFAAVFLLVLSFFGDAIVTVNLFHKNIFDTWHTWAGYLVLMLCVFVFHKKRHVHVRNEMHKHNPHGHH